MSGPSTQMGKFEVARLFSQRDSLPAAARERGETKLAACCHEGEDEQARAKAMYWSSKASGASCAGCISCGGVWRRLRHKSQRLLGRWPGQYTGDYYFSGGRR